MKNDFKPKFKKGQSILEISAVPDVLKMQIEELCEIRNANLRDYPEKMALKKKEFLEKYKNEYVECEFPWNKKRIKLLKEDLFFELRTARNKNLITVAEQKKFREATVAIAGLSVGSNIARMLTLQGGPKHLNLADHDVLGPTNLNRILAGVADMGNKKTEVLAKNLYETDPFAKLELFSDGLAEKNIKEFTTFKNKLNNVIVDEVDDLRAKILLRKYAQEFKLPLVSVTDNADGVIVAVERYDEEYTTTEFLKKLKKIPQNKKLSIKEKAIAVVKFIGIDDVVSDMLACVPDLGQKLYSWPQLGGAAVLSGVMGAYCVRKIILGKPLKSGRYCLDLNTFFSLDKENKNKRKQLLKLFR